MEKIEAAHCSFYFEKGNFDQCSLPSAAKAFLACLFIRVHSDHGNPH